MAQYNYVLAAAMLIGIPSAATIASSIMAKNPDLRPLAIARELWEQQDIDAPPDMIGIFVDWGRDHGVSYTQAELRQQIDSAMKLRTDAYFIRIQEVPGSGVDVTFAVGSNRYGPYPPQGLLQGIRPALTALGMIKAGQTADGGED